MVQFVARNSICIKYNHFHNNNNKKKKQHNKNKTINAGLVFVFGWSDGKIDMNMAPYHCRRDELTVQGGCVLRGM